MKKKKTFKELFAGTGIEPTTNENGGVEYNFNATLKKEPMKLQGTCTLSQTFMPTYSNETIKISSNDFLPSTSIFATTIDGELTDVINIKDCFNRLPKEEKLKVVSVLLEFCAAETNKLTNQNK
jgi:hypothetical protein